MFVVRVVVKVGHEVCWGSWIIARVTLKRSWSWVEVVVTFLWVARSKEQGARSILCVHQVQVVRWVRVSKTLDKERVRGELGARGGWRKGWCAWVRIEHVKQLQRRVRPYYWSLRVRLRERAMSFSTLLVPDHRPPPPQPPQPPNAPDTACVCWLALPSHPRRPPHIHPIYIMQDLTWNLLWSRLTLPIPPLVFVAPLFLMRGWRAQGDCPNEWTHQDTWLFRYPMPDTDARFLSNTSYAFSRQIYYIIT